MLENIIVVPLSPDLAPTVEAVCTLLNEAQKQFLFQARLPSSAPPPPDLEGAHSWDSLEQTLSTEKRQQEAATLFCVLDTPIEDNWFSHRVHAQRTCCLTVYEWGYLSDLPRSSFVAFSIVRNLVQILHGSNMFHEETRGCLNDLCAMKPDVSFGLRTGDICVHCRDSLSRLPSETLCSIIAMLEGVRRHALARHDVPVVAASSLPERVDREFPFPIAYCFRSMQTELSYSRKWLRLLELNEVTLKYITMVLLSAVRAGNEEAPEAASELRLNLQRPSLGHWNDACFRTLRRMKQEANHGFLSRFLDAINNNALRDVQAAADRLNHQRNETAHGFIKEETRYQHLYETHLGDIQTWMGFVSPLAGYELMVPTGQVKRRRGVTLFMAKVLMGSHPLFPSKTYQTNLETDTDCLLHDPNTGKFLSLYPWLIMDQCCECHHEMVFLYDKCDGRQVVMREYPASHTQKYEGEMREEIQKWLTP